MKKKQEPITDEALIQIFAILFQFVQDGTLNVIKFYEYKYKFLQQAIVDHEKKEPLKIFKMTHKNWALKKEELNVEIQKTYRNLMEAYVDFENFTGV